MALTILPYNDRSPVKSKQKAEALKGAVVGVADVWGEHQKKKRLGEALKGVEGIYNDPDMSQEQKFIKSFSTLQEFPEVAKQFSSGMSQFSESPLQKALRKKLKHETNQLKDEEGYFSRLMGDEGEQEPSAGHAAEMEEGIKPGKTAKPKFDYKNPSTWSDQEIDKFRSLEGKSTKAKTFKNEAQNEYERRIEAKKSATKYKEKVAPLEGALEVIGEMEKIGKKGNLGVGTKLRRVYSPETRKDAATYERFGKSLISYSTNIPIRNRAEFEALAHDLYDPSISDDARDGILTAMKKIIQNSAKSYTSPEEEGQGSRKSEKKERRPLTIFLR